MSSTVLIAVVLAALGALLLGAILLLWWQALSSQFLPQFSTRGITDNLKIGQHQKALERSDRLIEQREFKAAAPLLQEALILLHIKKDRALVERSVQFNLSVISRIISIAEHTGAHLENLAIVEDLIHSRGELQLAFLDGLRDRSAFQRRRSEAGKGAPDWALSEFNRKVEDLEERITTNKRSLQTQVKELLDAAANGPSTTITYH